MSDEVKVDAAAAGGYLGPPKSNFVTPLLTDLYQITMAYAYWNDGHHQDWAVFDLFFRKNPFGGEYTIFAGLEEVLHFLSSFRFTTDDIEFLKGELPHAKPGFWDYLASLDTSELKLFAVREGSVVFPRAPLLRVEGPLGICQLLETTLLCLCNYPSLMCTNASRFRRVAGDKVLLEFGLRRAQGPDGAISATRYAYQGGFDGTSNVLAAKLFNIMVKGTHAHAFVSSYTGLSDIQGSRMFRKPDGTEVDFVALVLSYKERLACAASTNMGELAAFIVYAVAFPNGLLCLVDTYDTLQSGVPNFLCVALALTECGHKPVGIRLDSGDLAYLSKRTRAMFQETDAVFGTNFVKCSIVASNDINQAVLQSLNDQGHSIDVFGIGTHLVTCQAQPALGMVYKLVEVRGQPRIKLSQELGKITIPGAKRFFRMVGKDNVPILDLMVRDCEEKPVPGVRILCKAPFDPKLQAYVTATKVVDMLELTFVGKAIAAREGLTAGVQYALPTASEIRAYAMAQLSTIREDVLRTTNPTPFKVSVSSKLYDFIQQLWAEEMPVAELR